ncbi:PP2C family protein-serine/threonine phosphatase [Pseudomonas sp. IT-P294]|uniref:PP2C family protein-serine/threonine phosphatase n=1 Tax=Pseudomonas sp. IT-P294 TaxID=3026454 RepID=UPI0039E13B85
MNHWNLPFQNQLTDWLSRRTARTGVRRVIPLAAAVASEIGNVRNENQDRAIVAHGWDVDGKRFAVAAVADGIGGMRDGGACAALALGTFIAVLNESARTGSFGSEDLLHRAVFAANEAVHSKFRNEGGSTLVAVLVRPNYPVVWLSVGDSRVYLTSGNSLVQVSIDDTIAGQLGKKEDAEIEQSKLLQFIGMGSDLEPHIEKIYGDPESSVILTTDGVHYLDKSPSWLGRIIFNSPDPGVCVKRLVELASWCGGPDNATVAVMPMSSSWDSDVKPSYDCLEVWDSFGELQLVFESASLDTLIKSRRDISRPPAVAYAAVPIASAPRAGGGGASSARKASSQKTISREKPVSVKKEKTQQKKVKSEVPQLLMEFPNKNN